MASSASAALTADEIDDLLYFTRVNEVDELKQTIAELSQKYQCGSKEVVEAGVDPESGNSVLHYCAANGLADLLPILLQHLSLPAAAAQGTNPSPPSQPSILNHQNAQGSTPLHWGALNGHLPVVKLLVAAGADMWIKNSAGHLAMFEAERADKGEVVQFLLEAGGKEVEKAGAEGMPDEKDVEEIEEDAGDGAANGVDVKMGEAGPS